jgi:hypothetical protein
MLNPGLSISFMENPNPYTGIEESAIRLECHVLLVIITHYTLFERSIGIYLVVTFPRLDVYTLLRQRLSRKAVQR